MNTVNNKERLLLLTADDRLEHLIAAEAHELCIGFRTERTSSALSSLPGTVRLILWDIDTVAPISPSPLPKCLIYGLTQKQPPVTTSLPSTHIWHRPFSVDHLRMELLRIICAEQPPLTSEDAHRLPVHIADDGVTLHIGESSFALTDNEAAIMTVLLQHRGKTVTKEQLRQASANVSVNAPSPEATSNKVEVYLCRLRAKLEVPLGRRLFTTVRGVGYRLDLGDEYTKQ